MKKSIVIFLFFLMLVTFTGCKKKDYIVVIQYDELTNQTEQFSIKEKSELPTLNKLNKEWFTFKGYYAKKNGVEFIVHNGTNYLIDDGKLNAESYDIENNQIIIYAKFESSNEDCYINIDYSAIQQDNKRVILKYGESMPKLTKISKEYYNFKGWYTNLNGVEFLIHNGINYENGFDNLNSSHYSIDENNTVTIYPKFEINKLECIIEENSGVETYVNKQHTIQLGDQMPDLEIPEKEHYVFKGWYTKYKSQDKLIFDSDGYKEGYNIFDVEHYEINNNIVEIYAKMELEKIPITFVYEHNNEDIETTYYITYGYSLKDYGPKVLNEYNEEAGYCWALDSDSELSNETLTATAPMKVYSIGVYTKFNNKYTAIKSHDNSRLLVDFRTANSNLNSNYISESGVRNITFIGNPKVTYQNFSITLSAAYEELSVTLIDFKYCAPENTIGLDASKLSENTVLRINARGNSQITGGTGSNGSNGTSYNINNSSSKPSSGQPGTAGTAGAPAIVSNNIYINIEISGSLTLIGGNGGNGGTGGNGEGSASKGIGQCGHGAVGGNGGNGANALVVNSNFSLNSVGNLITIGGNGGNGGNGGFGGNNQNTGLADRADHGGNGADGGNGGAGGLGIYIASQVKTEIEDGTTIYSTGGNGGIGGNGGNGGKSCKCELQTSNGGNPGNAGSGGYGGAGGDASNVNTLPLKRTGGQGNHGGYSGVPGTAHAGKVGNEGINRFEIWASDGN